MTMEIIIMTVTAVTLLSVTVQGIESRCTIPPVEKGETAILTCKFDSDVKNLRHEFQVHRDCQSKANPQETILFCGWNDDNPDCHMYERITLDRKITNTFQVMIHNVTKDDEGTYECLKFPFSKEQEKTKDCFFSIKDPEMTSMKSVDVSTLDHQNPHVSNCKGDVITVNCLIGAVVGTFTLTSIISVSITRAFLFLWFKHKLDLNLRISPRKDDQSQHTKLTLETCESSAFELSD